jgi:hypothetical protein
MYIGHHGSLFIVVYSDISVKLSSMTPEIKQDHPLNLSISVSGGKETNKDYLSSGE